METMNDFATRLDVVILGLAITTSIQKVSSNFSWPILFLFITSLTMSINFFYAKMHELSSDGGFVIDSVLDLYLHFFTLLPMAIMSLLIDKPEYFIVANIILRLTDILFILSCYNFKLKSINKIKHQWIVVDIIVLSYMTVFLLDTLLWGKIPVILLTLMIMIFWAIDAIFDYFTNHTYYFGKSESECT